MSQSDRAIKKLATQLARLDREVKSWRGAQADYTSIEGGTMDINDSDGKLVSRVGYQEDGSGATRFFDGPIPPVPSGVTASSDGPIIQATWDGTFEGGAEATYDLAYLEVAATQIDDDTNVSFATITAKEGASASVVADVTGDWVVAVRSVSQAGKKSEFATAGTVEVKLTDVAGAIEAVQDSANGKNKVTYSDRPPTPADPGIFDDTWFVGQVGRPEDIIEATNLATNPSFQSLALSLGEGNISTRAGAVAALSNDWSSSGSTSLKISGGTSWYTAGYVAVAEGDFLAQSKGKTFTASIDFHLEAAHDDTIRSASRRLTVNVQRGGSMQYEFAASNKAGAAAGTTERLSVTFTVPVDAEAWNVTAFNGSQTSTSYWDSLDIAEVASSRPYFDGDTPSGETDNESHYRWTGTPHASTSEKYLPALDIGDSDNWNIIEQYRHDGNGWVKVELSHYVFSTVDLGKATVGELDGIRIMARTMTSEVFTGTAFEGYFFKGTTFETTNGSEFSDRGLFMYDNDGNARIQAPTDGSDFTINAEIVARSLTSVGRASFLSEDNRIESGAGLVLAAGVGDPPSPPVVSTYYPTINPPALEGGATASGLAYGDGLFWRAVDAGSGLDHLDRIEGIDADGVVQRTIPLDLFWARNGLTVIGDELFALGRRDDLPASTRNNSRWVRVFGLDGTYKRQWEYKEYGSGTYQPGIGQDENGNLLIAQCWKTGELTWRAYNKTTGAVTNQFDATDRTRSDVSGIYVGSADFGAPRTLISKDKRENLNHLVCLSPTGAYLPDESWISPGKTPVKGVVWDGEKFYSVNTDGVISEYSTLSTGGGYESPWWAVYRWAKDVDNDLTMDLSSRISPPARFEWPRRARLKLSAPNLPIGVGEIAPSLAHQDTTPTRTDFRSPNWWSVTGEPVAHYYELPADWESYGVPGDDNSFPDGEPSTLTAASGLFEVKGDGSGHWGPLVFNPDGTMSSSAVPEWVPITTFKTGFGPQTWGDVPAYRIWPDGKVEWRGVVAGTMTGTAVILTMPDKAIPANPKNKAAATNSLTDRDAVVRVEFSPAADSTALRVYTSGADRTWVSLDELYYYLT